MDFGTQENHFLPSPFSLTLKESPEKNLHSSYLHIPLLKKNGSAQMTQNNEKFKKRFSYVMHNLKRNLKKKNRDKKPGIKYGWKKKKIWEIQRIPRAKWILKATIFRELGFLVGSGLRLPLNTEYSRGECSAQGTGAAGAAQTMQGVLGLLPDSSSRKQQLHLLH